jgi:CRP-like cAMP-binding protein
LLTGVVAIIDTKTNKHQMASAGTLIGEFSILTNKIADSTFRAASYVKTLSIPAELYLRFIARNLAVDSELSFQQKITALKASSLFGEMLPSTVISKIAHSMKTFSVPKGSTITLNESELIVLQSGEASVFFDDTEIETIGPGGIFGEESVLLKTATMSSCKALTQVQANRIPADTISLIPIVEWKILEIYERRITAFGMSMTKV